MAIKPNPSKKDKVKELFQVLFQVSQALHKEVGWLQAAMEEKELKVVSLAKELENWKTKHSSCNHPEFKLN